MLLKQCAPVAISKILECFPSGLSFIIHCECDLDSLVLLLQNKEPRCWARWWEAPSPTAWNVCALQWPHGGGKRSLGGGWWVVRIQQVEMFCAWAPEGLLVMPRCSRGAGPVVWREHLEVAPGGRVPPPGLEAGSLGLHRSCEFTELWGVWMLTVPQCNINICFENDF